ncbi:MAG: CDP-alcohol phosphatidyltransferase family protein [Spirochaetaceae bacterium]|jgi:CDP-diacylglycerol--glycerol-3-phosphate 3-phosphatidyltransferase|nr:CDP-alcohol phosphatidyltransferase family protein [Spirochaetaceae bacterium]
MVRGRAAPRDDTAHPGNGAGASRFWDRQKKHLPNLVSFSRIALVFPFLLSIRDNFIYNCTNLFSLITFLAIIISDIADGALARKLDCATGAGAKLDVIADALYTVLSLAAFAYFRVIPAWFPVIMVIKLLEFFITSRFIEREDRSAPRLVFDRLGKTAVIITMLLPGIFVMRCVITAYRPVMRLLAYIITGLFALSFCARMAEVLKPAKARRGKGAA